MWEVHRDTTQKYHGVVGVTLSNRTLPTTKVCTAKRRGIYDLQTEGLLRIKDTTFNHANVLHLRLG